MKIVFVSVSHNISRQSDNEIWSVKRKKHAENEAERLVSDQFSFF